jgi:pimeloyl-ACP methyl ester carboxylesterase
MGTTRRIAGGGGVELSVYECGDAGGRGILFIHGFAQSHLAWKYQLDSELSERFHLVAFDLRGHGMSEKPTGPENYTDGRLWADDVAAVIRALGLDRPVLVGWSYGGYVMCDYLQHYGDGGVGGLNFVDAGVRRGTERAQGLAGTGILDLLPALISTDLAENIAATRQFILNCQAAPANDSDLEQALAYNMMTPPAVREAMFSRALDFENVLGATTVPVLVTHGLADAIINPAMSELILSWVPRAEKSFYQDAGHAPFREDPDRFNRELARFVRAC